MRTLEGQRLELAELDACGIKALRTIEANGWELVELKPELGSVLHGRKRWEARVRRTGSERSMKLAAADANWLLGELARYTRCP